MKVLIDAELVKKDGALITVKLDTGFGRPELPIHADFVAFQDASPVDDLTRLPLLMAAEMTKKLESKRASKGGREGWLKIGPKELLHLLKKEVAELEDAIRREPDNVLPEAADVCNSALMIADKADKLEPMPDLMGGMPC